MKEETMDRMETVAAAGLAAAVLFALFSLVFLPVAWLMTSGILPFV